MLMIYLRIELKNKNILRSLSGNLTSIILLVGEVFYKSPSMKNKLISKLLYTYYNTL